MNKHLLAGVAVVMLSVAGFSTSASAQGKTRAEVRQELIDAQNHGLSFVTDTSYPEVSSLFRAQAERMQDPQARSGTGSQPADSSEAGKRAIAPSMPGAANCVGPVSFCSPYFGS
ncbi:hypothetical protein WT67_23520 [Burkholderia stagnalis]|uniref:DUF4148 domain-containing protein n=1 Tax=Burkholderia stagnalis TaxID=1503054 RepID=A0A6L3N3N0_9BURK|nr:DUF4148 domain-containing protein [Burkholderia stagnalis]KAB0639692.1 DUF4148 domain-containing protein [Burkholderia stagnalis]KVO40932.1 hypothetical protein WT17_17410 [Burkholderia stagnalis]KVO68687.1 hypothetical protein WT19_22120 [Burkholderia stagnalis]KVW63805.1 hypothetical protein WT28_12920 [Burkholderia stagnalis]KVW73599.1 hypothetical protein WT29_26690 [Burkholderia stagnalis]